MPRSLKSKWPDVAAYLELNVEGGRKAYIEAGAIAGLVTSPGQNALSVSSKEKPLLLILRGGAEYMIVGESAGKVLTRAMLARKKVRDEGLEILVDWLETPDAADDDLPVQE